MKFQDPPVILNAEGKTRAVGFELEFAGLSLDRAAALIAELFGGKVEKRKNPIIMISGTRLGDFSVEIDSRYIKDEKYREVLRGLGIEIKSRAARDIVEELLVGAASWFVPTEVICPPVPLGQLESIENLREALKSAGAKGSKASMLYAFGMQINTEVPRSDAGTLLQYLRAFFLLYDWLEGELEIDLTRRLLPFINPFPYSYIQQVLEPGYAPDLERLVDDYLQHNPSRNRPLDMLPLFAFLNEGKVMSSAEEPFLIKKRPAFHYRLPSCLIDDPDWNLAREWNYWVEVEKLSASPDRIQEMSRAYLEMKGPHRGSFPREWRERVGRWLHG
jgi:hypothetical protein